MAPGTRCPQEDVKTTAHLGPSLPGKGGDSGEGMVVRAAHLCRSSGVKL